MAMFAGFRFRFSVNAFHVLSSTIAVFVIAIMLGAAGPAAAAPEALVQQIAIGGDHGCALTLSGGVKCWGSNANGQVGDGSTTNRLAPVDVPDLSGGVTTIAAGAAHTCVLTRTGSVKCWGLNDNGQLGDGSSTASVTPVDVVGLGSGITAIAAGDSHTCALTSDGTVKCWGGNGFGQLGDGTAIDRLMPVDVAGAIGGVLAITAGVSHTCILVTAGGARCWGGNLFGQLGDGTASDRLQPVDVLGLASGVTAIVAGGFHTCALAGDGNMKCWGRNSFGQLGNDTVSDRTAPVDVVALVSRAMAIAAGRNHTCALDETGGVQCWGNNEAAQLGNGTTAGRYMPDDVVGLSSGVTAIAAGSSQTCALIDTGGVKCWGNNKAGQLGDGTGTERLTPVDVSGLTGAIGGIVAGAGHTCSLIGTGIKFK